MLKRQCYKDGAHIKHKLKTPEIKEMAYEQYLNHIARGKSSGSWYFDHPDVTLSGYSMERYIKREPEFFDEERLQVARAKGYQVWENVADNAADGTNPDINSAALQMVMRNKFDWDRKEHETNSIEMTALENNFSTLMAQIKMSQSKSLTYDDIQINSESISY